MKAVFLDRDGVLNHPVIRDGKPFPPASVDEFVLYNDARSGCERLREAGFLLVVVTNQPDVARRTQSRCAVDQMHERLRGELPIAGIYVCFHDDSDHCGCRKPKPGLLLAAAAERGLALPKSIMIGDRWRDIEAGRAAGCRTVWIDRQYSERVALSPDAVVDCFSKAVDWILTEELNVANND